MKLSFRKYHSISKIWLSFFLVKIAWMLFGVFIFDRLSQLGDTARYISGPFAWVSGWQFNSTYVMDTVASSIATLSGPIFVHIFFIIISIFGIYYPLKKINPTKNQLYIVLFLLCLPSFGMWTSVATKEAVTVLFLGIMLAGMIDLIEKRPIEKPLLLIFAIYLCTIFKPQYLIGLFALLTYVGISRTILRYGYGKLISIAIFVLISITILYQFRDIIDGLSRLLPVHFVSEGSSSRSNTFWIEQYDFFRYAIYGMFISFTGPTLFEAFSKPLMFLGLLESMVIWAAFILSSTILIMKSMRHRRVNIFMFGIFLIPTIWILFVHYPFGVFNPGSALRYRSGFISFLIILFLFCYRKTLSSLSANNKVIVEKRSSIV